MTVLVRRCMWCTLQVFLLVLFAISALCGTGFPDDSFYPSSLYYTSQQAIYTKFKTAIDLLQHEPRWVNNWPDPSVQLGQVSGVAVDNTGLVYVFHRASNAWRADTFNAHNVYQAIGDPAIPHPTVLVFNNTGNLVDMWGQNLFYMPHGITVDSAGNVWVTDVALHQVFKFTPQDRTQSALTLGEKFVPGYDETHFCKPSAVSVQLSGEFFVADGYCNTRIIKYAPDGTKLLQWGRATGQTPFTLNIPHALALAEDRGVLCVADREHGRVPCFRADNGTYHSMYHSWLFGGRLFSVAYAPVDGGRLYTVNGPHGGLPVRGYVIDFASGKLISTFSPPAEFHNPHDVAVTADGSALYVAELDPHAVHKFEAPPPAPGPPQPLPTAVAAPVKPALPVVAGVVTPVKPTATVEAAGDATTSAAGGGLEAWRGALGGAAGGLAAALCALAALALFRARSRGSKRGGSTRRRWEYASEFKLRRLLERRRFTRVDTDDSDEEPSPAGPMLSAPATA